MTTYTTTTTSNYDSTYVEANNSMNAYNIMSATITSYSLPLVESRIKSKGGICTCQKKGPCRGTCLS